MTVRATKNLIQKILFDTLKNHEWGNIKNKVICDAFAGSGNIGLQFIKRGAKYIYFLEKNIYTCQNIENSMKKNKVTHDTYHVHRCNVYTFFNRGNKHEKYDIIFYDPPYNNSHHVFTLISSLSSMKTLHIVETHSSFQKITTVPLLLSKTSGNSSLHFIKYT